MLKESLLVAGAQQHVKIRDMTLTSEQLTRLLRLAEQMVKAARVMVRIREAASLAEGQEKSAQESVTLEDAGAGV